MVVTHWTMRQVKYYYWKICSGFSLRNRTTLLAKAQVAILRRSVSPCWTALPAPRLSAWQCLRPLTRALAASTFHTRIIWLRCWTSAWEGTAFGLIKHVLNLASIKHAILTHPVPLLWFRGWTLCSPLWISVRFSSIYLLLRWKITLLIPIFSTAATIPTVSNQIFIRFAVRPFSRANSFHSPSVHIFPLPLITKFITKCLLPSALNIL